MRRIVLLSMLLGAPAAFAGEGQDQSLTQHPFDHTLQQDQQMLDDQQQTLDDQMITGDELGENEDEVLPPRDRDRRRDRIRDRRRGDRDFNAICRINRRGRGRDVRGFGAGRSPQQAIRRAMSDARNNCLYNTRGGRGGRGRGCHVDFNDCRLVDRPGPR